MEDFVDIEKAHFTFPERLMELLQEEQVKDAMWWLPGGHAFAIRPKIFYDAVLSKYFQGTKFESFTRKLNRWGFRRLASQGVPQSTVAYYHKMFKQGQPDMVKNMRSGNKSKFNETTDKPMAAPSSVRDAGASQPMLAMSQPAAAARHVNETAEARTLRDYLRNQSIVAARQAQEHQVVAAAAAALRHHQAAAQHEKGHSSLLAASLQLRGSEAGPAASMAMHQNLVAMQKRARLMAAQQYAALHGQPSVQNIREQLFSGMNMSLLDTPALTAAAAPQADALSSSQQLVRLMLLREQFGGGQAGVL